MCLLCNNSLEEAIEYLQSVYIPDASFVNLSAEAVRLSKSCDDHLEQVVILGSYIRWLVVCENNLCSMGDRDIADCNITLCSACWGHKKNIWKCKLSCVADNTDLSTDRYCPLADLCSGFFDPSNSGSRREMLPEYLIKLRELAVSVLSDLGPVDQLLPDVEEKDVGQ